MVYLKKDYIYKKNYQETKILFFISPITFNGLVGISYRIQTFGDVDTGSIASCSCNHHFYFTRIDFNELKNLLIRLRVDDAWGLSSVEGAREMLGGFVDDAKLDEAKLVTDFDLVILLIPLFNTLVAARQIINMLVYS